MISEAKIESHFVNFASQQNCLALKLRIDGANGWPDRTVITPKGIFFVEFKRADGSLRPAQRRIIAELEAMGYTVLAPREIGVAEAFLSGFLSR